MLIENVSNDIQIVVGIPRFSPGEVKEVSDEVGEQLLKNSNFAKKIKTKKIEKSK